MKPTPTGYDSDHQGPAIDQHEQHQLVGSDTVVGDSGDSGADDIITAATTMSMTMNGRKIRKPI